MTDLAAFLIVCAAWAVPVWMIIWVVFFAGPPK